MARIERKDFAAAIEAGIAVCPLLRDFDRLAYPLRSTVTLYTSQTLIGRWATDNAECPLIAAGLIRINYSGALHRASLDITDRTQGIVGADEPVFPSDFDSFWRAFDAYARPRVKSWDGDTKTPISIIN